MIRALILIGLLLAPSAHAQSETLYNQVKALIEFEDQSTETELILQRFSLGLYYDQVQTITDESGPNPINVPFEIAEETYADLAVTGEYSELCGTEEEKKVTYGVCHEVMNQIQVAIEKNSWHRQLGRELQMIAAGYETGMDGYPGKAVDIIPRLFSITHLWRAGSDTLINPFVEFLTRARQYPAAKEEDIEEASKAVVELLQDMIYKWEEGETEKKDDTKLRAMLHRYRHGVRRVIAEDGDCEDYEQTLVGINTSLYWLYARDCDLEDALIELSDLLQKDQFEIGFDEQVIYPAHIDKEKNIYLWMRYDDVGLQPVLPFEPVQTTIATESFLDCIDDENSYRDCYEADPSQLVRGGRYPPKLDVLGTLVPQPGPGQGVCSHPFGKRGYLCRDTEQEICDLNQEQKNQLAANGTGGIILTGCKPQKFRYPVAKTVSGPNICGIGGWREEVEGNKEEDTPAEDRYMEVPPCSACAVDIICSQGGTCPAGTLVKRDGIIEICLPEEEEKPGDSLTTLVQKFVQARQMCGESPLQTAQRTQGAEGCCAAAQEAHFAQCKVYATLGILENIQVTIEECASLYANTSCQQYDADPDDDFHVCTEGESNPALVQGAITAQLAQMAQAGTLRMPTTCSEAMKDPRILALRNSLPLSCKPGCQAQYQNTIGNNFCFTGQCLEETQEWSRSVPGRMGLTTLDQDFPWDACMLPDPNLGNFDVPPALLAPTLPAYNPERFVRELDEELCQINGLPLQMPSILCAYNPQLSLDLEREEYAQIAQDLRSEPEDYDATGVGVEYSAQGVGARIATEMFTAYLTPAARSFADILSTMHHIFHRVGDLTFPDTMCPRYASDSYSCNQLTQ